MPLFLSPIERIRRKAQKRLDEVTPQGRNFYVLISLSAALAALGLFMDNAAVIIGAMVVAPLVTPLFTLSLSLLIFDVRGVLRAIQSIVLGTILAIIVGACVGYIVYLVYGNSAFLTEEIISRSKPDALYFFVALVSGLAGSFAYARPKIKEFVTGVAIAAAIIPPIAVTGIALSLGNIFLFQQSLYLYMFNVVGICFGSVLMFIALGFGKEVEKTTSTKK